MSPFVVFLLLSLRLVRTLGSVPGSSSSNDAQPTPDPEDSCRPILECLICQEPIQPGEEYVADCLQDERHAIHFFCPNAAQDVIYATDAELDALFGEDADGEDNISSQQRLVANRPQTQNPGSSPATGRWAGGPSPIVTGSPVASSCATDECGRTQPSLTVALLEEDHPLLAGATGGPGSFHAPPPDSSVSQHQHNPAPGAVPSSIAEYLGHSLADARRLGPGMLPRLHGFDALRKRELAASYSRSDSVPVRCPACRFPAQFFKDRIFRTTITVPAWRLACRNEHLGVRKRGASPKQRWLFRSDKKEPLLDQKEKESPLSDDPPAQPRPETHDEHEQDADACIWVPVLIPANTFGRVVMFERRETLCRSFATVPLPRVSRRFARDEHPRSRAVLGYCARGSSSADPESGGEGERHSGNHECSPSHSCRAEDIRPGSPTGYSQCLLSMSSRPRAASSPPSPVGIGNPEQLLSEPVAIPASPSEQAIVPSKSKLPRGIIVRFAEPPFDAFDTLLEPINLVSLQLAPPDAQYFASGVERPDALQRAKIATSRGASSYCRSSRISRRSASRIGASMAVFFLGFVVLNHVFPPTSLCAMLWHSEQFNDAPEFSLQNDFPPLMGAVALESGFLHANCRCPAGPDGHGGGVEVAAVPRAFPATVSRDTISFLQRTGQRNAVSTAAVNEVDHVPRNLFLRLAPCGRVNTTCSSARRQLALNKSVCLQNILHSEHPLTKKSWQRTLYRVAHTMWSADGAARREQVQTLFLDWNNQLFRQPNAAFYGLLDADGREPSGVRSFNDWGYAAREADFGPDDRKIPFLRRSTRTWVEDALASAIRRDWSLVALEYEENASSSSSREQQSVDMIDSALGGLFSHFIRIAREVHYRVIERNLRQILGALRFGCDRLQRVKGEGAEGGGFEDDRGVLETEVDSVSADVIVQRESFFKQHAEWDFGRNSAPCAIHWAAPKGVGTIGREETPLSNQSQRRGPQKRRSDLWFSVPAGAGGPGDMISGLFKLLYQQFLRRRHDQFWKSNSARAGVMDKIRLIRETARWMVFRPSKWDTFAANHRWSGDWHRGAWRDASDRDDAPAAVADEASSVQSSGGEQKVTVSISYRETEYLDPVISGAPPRSGEKTDSKILLEQEDVDDHVVLPAFQGPSGGRALEFALLASAFSDIEYVPPSRSLWETITKWSFQEAIVGRSDYPDVQEMLLKLVDEDTPLGRGTNELSSMVYQVVWHMEAIAETDAVVEEGGAGGPGPHEGGDRHHLGCRSFQMIFDFLARLHWRTKA